jgi:sortase A
VAPATLLLVVLFVVSACGNAAGQGSGQASAPSENGKSVQQESEGRTVESVNPEDVLSEDELTGAPESRQWNDPAAEGYEPSTSEFFVGTDTSTGAIPAVKPFNFGRDPGGPDDKTLSLDIPKLGLEGVSAFDSVSEEKLKQGVIRVPATGFPWQEGANTYIAGHRIGYPDTPSDRIFYDLPELVEGDEVTLTDASGREYVYRITTKEVVGPENVQVMNPPEDGSSIITLQTCTLPNYEDRIVVQGELVEGDTTAS